MLHAWRRGENSFGSTVFTRVPIIDESWRRGAGSGIKQGWKPFQCCTSNKFLVVIKSSALFFMRTFHQCCILRTKRNSELRHTHTHTHTLTHPDGGVCALPSSCSLALFGLLVAGWALTSRATPYLSYISGNSGLKWSEYRRVHAYGKKKRKIKSHVEHPFLAVLAYDVQWMHCRLRVSQN